MAMVAVSVLGVSGCGGGNGGGDDDGGGDGGDGSQCAPLTGTAPFAVHMEGSATLTKRGMSTQRELGSSIDLFFPQGRTPGAQVFASRRAGQIAMVQTAAVIGADGSSGPIRLSAQYQVYGFSIDGALEAAPGGFRAQVGVETGFNDVSEFYEGPMELCATGVPAAPSLLVEVQTWSPLAQIRIVPTTALDLTTLPTVRASAAGTNVPIRVDPGADSIVVSPLTAFPPDGQVVLDLTGVRDVLGGSPAGGTVMLDAPPSAEVADLTFANPLPAGSAVVGQPVLAGGGPVLEVVNGVLNIQVDFWSGATIALGARAGSTAIIRHKLDCKFFSVPVQRVAIFAEDGSFTELPLACGDNLVETRLAVPATGRRWLAVAVQTNWLGAPRPNPGKLTIDEIRFE
jgi:hypothetical protein